MKTDTQTTSVSVSLDSVEDEDDLRDIVTGLLDVAVSEGTVESFDVDVHEHTWESPDEDLEEDVEGFRANISAEVDEDQDDDYLVEAAVATIRACEGIPIDNWP